jgi:hypothetical protein
VSPAGSGRRPPGWRTVNATLGGIVAGVCGVVLARAAFGRDAAVAGVVIGTVALVAGGWASWGLSSPARRSRSHTGLPGGRRLRSRVHPLAWFAPVVGSAVAMLAWAGVAHSSGSGWVQAVGALLAAVLIAGIVAPMFPARRAALTCTGSPSDTEAGRALELTMVANGPIRIRPRYPVGTTAQAVGSAHGPRVVEVTITPDRRGVVEEVAVELATCAPFGLLWWARDVQVPLPRPLHVAPRQGEPGPIDTLADKAAGDSQLRVSAGSGEPRGVRPYQPGDTRRSVHWPATSHVGSLMVRETDRQTDDPIIVDVVLPPDPQQAEAESERIMATLSPYLARGQSVVLATLEPEGRAVRLVRDRVDLGRRLARAVPPPTVTGAGGGADGPIDAATGSSIDTDASRTGRPATRHLGWWRQR